MNDSLVMNPNGVRPMFRWAGSDALIAWNSQALITHLNRLDVPGYVIEDGEQLRMGWYGNLEARSGVRGGYPCLGVVPAFTPEHLGDPGFKSDYGLRFAYHGGALANGIASEDMVIALGRAGMLGTFGSGGLDAARIERAIHAIQAALPEGPYAFNLLHNPADPRNEWVTVEQYMKYGVRVIEASAFMNVAPSVVYFRAAGLKRDSQGAIRQLHRIIAKVSRPEVAEKFLSPAPREILDDLVRRKAISAEQARLACEVPVASDITVEADSGGHTDRGALVCILPNIIRLRDEFQARFRYAAPVRIGAAGGIGTPQAALAAYTMGASYIVTGSVNQCCIEAGTSREVKSMLAEADIADVMMTPAADMFEMGIKVQVLKRGTLYPVRAQKLYDLYKRHPALSDIPEPERLVLEKQIFRKPIESVWVETQEFLRRRLPDQLAQAESNPKKKMALLFQWYLGQSSKWATSGDTDRQLDYQIWCGPALGAFNAWVKGSDLERIENRRVVDVALNLLHGAAYLYRIKFIKGMGLCASPLLERVSPQIINVNQAATSAIRRNLNHGEDPAMTSINTAEVMKSKESSKLHLKKSKEYYKRAWEYLPGGTHYNFADHQNAMVVPFARGRNSRVWDLDGNEHLDLFCKFGALITGHYNTQYNAALIAYMEKVTSVDICDLEVEVGELMIHAIPCAEQVRFCLSGTEAVQNALRLARGYTGKNRFIRFHGHYHGNADNIMGGKLNPDLSHPTPVMFKGDFLGTAGRDPNIMAQQSFVLPWNEIEILKNTIGSYKDEIAAIIMEPISINGGGIMPKPGYLESVKQLCDQNNIVLIFDEIITGYRAGLGGAQDMLGVTPHLATFGKALGGGSMPVSAIAGHRDIMDLYRTGKVIHAGTFNGYPLGLAAVKATIELLMNDTDCYMRMGTHMTAIANSLIGAANDLGMPMIVQGLPTAMVFHSQAEMVESAEGYPPEVKVNDIVIREVCKRYGIQFSPLSRIYANVLMSEDDVTFFNDRIGDAMAEAKKLIDLNIENML